MSGNGEKPFTGQAGSAIPYMWKAIMALCGRHLKSVIEARFQQQSKLGDLGCTTATLLMIGLAELAVPVAASAQAPDLCQVQITPIVSFGDRDGPGALANIYGTIRVDSRNRYYVIDRGGTSVLVFDAGGKYVRTIGRAGEGPGEFRETITIELARNDSLMVFDFGTSRVTVYSPDHVLVRTIRIPIIPNHRVALLPDGGFAFATNVRSRELVGYPVHLFSSTGQLQRSLGSDGNFDPTIPRSGDRIIAPASDGNLWVAHLNQYVIEKWTPDGRRLDEIRRDVSWFRPQSRPSVTRGPQPPPTTLSAIAEDSTGLLWVSVHQPKESWRDYLRPGVDHTMFDDGVMQTHIEAIDTRRGVAVATTLVPHEAHIFPRPGLMAILELDSAGYPVARAFRLSPCIPPTRR
jgi:hypothetical protein